MATSIRDNKKSRGRPKTTGTGTLLGARWHAPEIAEIDDWRRLEADLPTRAEAIRRLVRLGLDAAGKKARRRNE